MSRLNALTVKPAYGYHYKDLSVVYLGRLAMVTAVSTSELPFWQPLHQAPDADKPKRIFYRIITEIGVVMFSDNYRVLLSDRKVRCEWADYSAILVTSRKGEAFIVLVRNERIAEIKRICFNKTL